MWNTVSQSLAYVVLLVVALMVMELVFAGARRVRARWRQRAARRLQGGPTNADPARIYRETAREVERLAHVSSRSDAGPDRRMDTGVMVPAARVHGDVSRRPGESGKHLRTGGEDVRGPTPGMVRYGRSGYGGRHDAGRWSMTLLGMEMGTGWIIGGFRAEWRAPAGQCREYMI